MRTVQHSTCRNLCCTWDDAYVPLGHFTDCQDGAANGAGPWRCTAGVTPASVRTRDRRTEARTGPGPLCPRNGKRPPTIQRTCDDTARWPPRRPADGQQRAAGHREGSQGLTSPSRHAHLRRYYAVGAIRRCQRRTVRGGSGPSVSPPFQLGRPPRWKGTDDNRTATFQGDVAWAAAGVLEPRGTSFGTVALWDPSRCQCLSVVRS